MNEREKEDLPLAASKEIREEFRRLREATAPRDPRAFDVDLLIRFLSDCGRMFREPGGKTKPRRPLPYARVLL